MSQSKTPAQFKELIEAARFSAQAGVDVANMLLKQDGDSRASRVHLRQQQERAAEIERQILIIERMTGLFSKVLA